MTHQQHENEKGMNKCHWILHALYETSTYGHNQDVMRETLATVTVNSKHFKNIM